MKWNEMYSFYQEWHEIHQVCASSIGALSPALSELLVKTYSVSISVAA